MSFSAAVLPQLRRHLLRTRIGRTVGVTIAFAAEFVAAAISGATPHGWYAEVGTKAFDPLPTAVLGYVIASVWSELTKPRDITGSAGGVAVLAPRRIRDFADRSVLRPTGALAALAAAAAATVLVWAAPTPPPTTPGSLEPAILAVGVVAAAAGAGAAALICRRGERASTDTAVAYEELTRSGTVNALVGATAAGCAVSAAALLGSAPLRGWIAGWVLWPSSFMCSAAGLATWYSAGTALVFRSRRMDSLRRRQDAEAAAT